MTDTTTSPRVAGHTDRRGMRDRLELLTALLNGPTVEAFYREDVIRYPDDHRVFAWRCSVASCDSPRTGRKDMCHQHIEEWARLKVNGGSRFEFARTASPSVSTLALEQRVCRICLHRPASPHSKDLCERHNNRWMAAQREGWTKAGFDRWAAGEAAFPSYGQCQVTVCTAFAANPVGLCPAHHDSYNRARQPGAAILPRGWDRLERTGKHVDVLYADKAQFRRWCANAAAIHRPGQTDLRGLPPLVAAEIRYGLFAHTQRETHTIWDLRWVHFIVHAARQSGIRSLLTDDIEASIHGCEMVLREIRRELQLVYFTPASSRPRPRRRRPCQGQ